MTVDDPVYDLPPPAPAASLTYVQHQVALPGRRPAHLLPCQDPLSVSLPGPGCVPFAEKLARHWQLRSMLCSPSPNILYYPSGDRIYQINTATRKRRLIGTLPFEPRCVGARYGWVCVGGAEHGQFATIRMKDEEAADEDEAMALDMDMDGPDEPRTRPRRSVATVMALGGTIVNSITLHRPPSSTSDDDVLAVLTYGVSVQSSSCIRTDGIQE